MIDAANLVWPDGLRKLWVAKPEAAYVYTVAGRPEAALADPIIINKGQTFELPIRYTDAGAAGLLDLTTGYTATWTLSSGLHAGATTVIVPTNAGAIAFGGAEGDAYNLRLSLTATETAALALTRAMHTCVLISGSTKMRLFEGTLVVQA